MKKQHILIISLIVILGAVLFACQSKHMQSHAHGDFALIIVSDTREGENRIRVAGYEQPVKLYMANDSVPIIGTLLHLHSIQSRGNQARAIIWIPWVAKSMNTPRGNSIRTCFPCEPIQTTINAYGRALDRKGGYDVFPGC